MRSSSFLEFARRNVPIFLVLLAGGTLSLLVFQIKREAVSERQRAIFAELAHGYARSLQWEIDAHLSVLQTLRDFVIASPEIDKVAFASFARASLDRAPALQSLKWLPAVPAEERARFEEEVARDEAGEFVLFGWDEEGRPLPSRPVELHYPVRFAEVRDEGSPLLGFDFASDPLRRQALATAEERGGLGVSAPLDLLAGEEDRHGVVLVMPIYLAGESPRQVRGFIAGSLDLAILGRHALPDIGSQGMSAVLRDGSGERRVPLFVAGLEGEGTRPLRLQAPFSLGGRQWELDLRARSREVAPGAALESWGTLALGLLFTGFTALWIRQRLHYLHSVERKVGERTAALSRINADLQNEMAQRRQAEAELQASEIRFREAFLHAPVGIGLLSPQGRWMQVNRALTEMTGFSEEELASKSLADLLLPGEVQRELARMGQMLAGEIRTFAFEQQFRRRDGQGLAVLMNISQVRDDHDRLLYFICQVLDISERNRALEETRRAKEFSENIIRSSTDGILAFDLEGRFTVWNAGMEEMTGILASQAVGRPSKEVLPFLMENGDDRAFQRVLAGGTVRAAERPFAIPSSGRRGYFAGHYAPLHDEQGGIIGGVAVVRDVTGQREARERLQAFAELLKQRNRELQDFAYVASHDLQEPLRKIRAFGDRLALKCQNKLDEQAQDYLNRMQDAAGRMQTLIQDLLAFSRISTEAHPFAPVDLGKVVREVLGDLESVIEETGARVEIGRLPTIEADATQMRQLVQNLIGNGLKYRRADLAPHIQIYATTHAAEDDLPPLEGAGCLLHVEDNGIGFDEKYLDRIFTVFQRLHGRNEYPGTGVGLAICRKIAERHNGWITARSTPGEGSTFITALPYKQNQRN